MWPSNSFWNSTKVSFSFELQGLFARRRMLLLTLGPHLYYVDPVNMVLKGEIPWSPELRVEPKNFKIFFVHTVSLKGGVFFKCKSIGHTGREVPEKQYSMHSL
jgi:hypothetical protein